MEAFADEPRFRKKTTLVLTDKDYKTALIRGIKKVEKIGHEALPFLKNMDYAYISGADQVDSRRNILKGVKNLSQDISFRVEKDVSRCTGREFLLS